MRGKDGTGNGVDGKGDADQQTHDDQKRDVGGQDVGQQNKHVKQIRTLQDLFDVERVGDHARKRGDQQAHQRHEAGDRRGKSDVVSDA